MEKYAITVNNVFKTYIKGFIKKRRVQALKGVSLSVKYGEIFGLLGPNGAGKTTLLNIISTQLTPDDGYVEILDKKIDRHNTIDTNIIKSEINMCSGNPNFPWSMTPYEILNFYAMLYGIKKEERKKIIKNLISMLELDKHSNVQYDELSTGTKQKLALAKSLLNSPKVLLLDEPTIGLDPDIAKKIRNLILNIRKEREITIILTTHYMREAEELCERIAFIKDGLIKATGTVKEIEKIAGKDNLEDAFIEFAH